jgi:formyltetrahydrofolate hydrolase
MAKRQRPSSQISADDVVARGRDIENVSLSHAVKFPVQRRIIAEGARTIRFRR